MEKEITKKKLSKRIKKFFGLKKKAIVEENNPVEFEDEETEQSVYELDFSDDDEPTATIAFPQTNIIFEKVEVLPNQLVRRLSLESVRTVTLVRIPEKREKETKDLPSKIKEIFGEENSPTNSNPFQYGGFETVHGHGKFYEQTIMKGELKRSNTELGKSRSVPQFSTQARQISGQKADNTAILSIDNILNDVEELIANLNRQDDTVNNIEPQRKSLSLPRPETEKSKWKIVQQYVSQQITTPPVEEPVAKELQVSGNRLQNRLKAIAHERVQDIKNPTLKSAFSEESIRKKQTAPMSSKSVEAFGRPNDALLSPILEINTPPMPKDTITRDYLKKNSPVKDTLEPLKIADYTDIPEKPLKSAQRNSDQTPQVDIYDSFEQQLAELTKAIASISDSNVPVEPVEDSPEMAQDVELCIEKPIYIQDTNDLVVQMKEEQYDTKPTMVEQSSIPQAVENFDNPAADIITPEDAQSMNTSLDRASTILSITENTISRSSTPIITIAHKREGTVFENYESTVDKPLPESPKGFERKIKTETFDYEIQDFSPPTSRRNSGHSDTSVSSSVNGSVDFARRLSLNSDDMPLQRKLSKMVISTQTKIGQSSSLDLNTGVSESQKSLSIPELIIQGPASPTSLQYNRGSRTISDPRLVAAGVDALPAGVTSTLVTQPDGKEQIVLNFGDEEVSVAERKFSVEPRRVSLHETGSIKSHRVQSGESESVKFFDRFSFDRKRKSGVDRESKSIDRDSKSMGRKSKSFEKPEGIVGTIGSLMDTLSRIKNKRPSTPEIIAIENQLDPLYEQISKLDKSQFNESDINALLKAIDALKSNNKTAGGHLSPVVESPSRYDNPSTVSLISSNNSIFNRRNTPSPFNADNLYGPIDHKKESKPFLKRVGSKFTKGVMKMSSMNNILRKDTVKHVNMQRQSSHDTIDRIMASNGSTFDNQRYIKK